LDHKGRLFIRQQARFLGQLLLTYEKYQSYVSVRVVPETTAILATAAAEVVAEVALSGRMIFR
jgi:hypothetical protein